MTELPLDRPNTLAERVAQLIFVRIGSNLPPIKRASQDKERISKLLEKHPLGGLVLFNAKWPDLQETLRDLQSISRYPLLVAADLERGAGQQIHGLGVFPHARAFSELAGDQLDAVQEAAYLTARQALAVGVQVILGPVADVNSNPHNPIIATRAFANTPEGAAKLVTAYIEGAKKGGAICVPKHFPGHGDTQQDSHATLPVVRKTYDELQQCELPPFEAAITAGVPMIMTAHVAYPMLDPSGEPATVSTKILNHLLRKDLKFDGAICSDSLLMAGVRDRYTTEGDCAIAALSAGVDLLLDLVEPDLAIKSITRAVESGELAEERVNDAFDRVWKLKSGYFRSSISSEDPL